MSYALGQPLIAAVSRLQEWQQLSWTAASRVMGHYLHGCADLAMAHTPRQALAALHKAQRDILKQSVDTVAEATKLWHMQTTELPTEYRVPSKALASSVRSTKG